MKFETVVTLIQSFSIKKRLSALACMFIKRDIPVHVNADGGSYTDGKRIVIGVPSQIVKEMIDKKIIVNLEQVVSMLKHLVAHESEHVRSSSFPLFIKFMDEVEKDYMSHKIRGAGQVIGKGIMNGIEDGRIERRAINRLPGIGKHIQFSNLCFYKVVGKVENDLLRDYLMSLCVLATSNLYLEGWHKTYGQMDVGKLLEDCIPLVKKAVASETPEECYDVCKEIHNLSMPILLPYIKDDLSKQQQAQQFAQDGDIDNNPRMDNADRKDKPGNSQKQYSNQKKSSKSKDKSKDQDQGQGSSGDDSQSGEEKEENADGQGGQSGSEKEDQDKDSQKDGSGADGEDQGKQDQKDGDGEKNQDGESSSKKNPQNNQQQNNNIGGGHEADDSVPEELTPEELSEAIKRANELVYGENEKQLADSKKEDAQNAKAEAALKAKRAKNRLTPEALKKISSRHSAKYIEFSSKEPLDSKSKERSSFLEKTILRILKNKKTEELRYKRSGNIDKRSLVRFISNKDNDVFYQSARNEVDDAAFYLLIDHSGSMSGDKMLLALTSASVIQDAVQKHCPLRVVGFNSGSSQTCLYDYKDFDDRSNGSLIKFQNNATNANCDGYAIKVATEELSKRHERIKIMFVLSDGYPTVAFEKGEIIDAKNAVIEARKKGITVIPIVFDVDGCDRNNFETIYEKNIIMCEPVEIEKQLSKLLEKIIKVM